jgi:hypothetical protein
VIRSRISLIAIAGAFWPAAAWAQAPPGEPAAATSDGGRADALFNEAKGLRDTGHYAEACPKFAESRNLANGVGVTLYLADCYEKVGKTQSAWTEFRNAETMARAKGDKRADIAAARAQALEPKLNRVTLAIPLAAGQVVPLVAVDGTAVPPEQLNSALAMDPGDHQVQIIAPGHPTRVLPVHVDPSVLSIVVPLAEPEAAVAAPAGEGAGAVPLAAAASTGDPGATKRWIGLGLIAAGVGAAGVGTWLLTSKVTDMTPEGMPCDSHLRSGSTPWAAVLFGAGGVAAVSGIVLIVTASHHTTEVALGPMALPGGGGALLQGAF